MTAQLSSWCHPPERPELKSDDAHVWRVIGGSTAGNGQTLRGEPVIAAFWILGSMG
jgi:hypothetical protein